MVHVTCDKPQATKLDSPRSVGMYCWEEQYRHVPYPLYYIVILPGNTYGVLKIIYLLNIIFNIVYFNRDMEGGDRAQERGPRMSDSGVMQIRCHGGLHGEGHGWLHTSLDTRTIECSSYASSFDN